MKVTDWNESHPIGTPVRYYPVQGEPHFRDTRTRSAAWELSSGHVVVQVEGVSGGVSIEHLGKRNRSPREAFDEIGSVLLQSGADMHGIAMMLEAGAMTFTGADQLDRVIALATVARDRLNEILPTLERVRKGDDL